MQKKIKFNIQMSNLEDFNPNIARYKCFICYSDDVANNFVFSKDVLEDMSSSVMGSPVLTYYDGNKFGGHEGDLYNANGILKRTPKLTGVGFADYLDKPSFEEHDGKNFLTCTTYLWKNRLPDLSKINSKDVHQSMEVDLDYLNDSTGKHIVTKAICTGLALIGVNPAFKGAGFEKFSLSIDKDKQEIVSEINKLKNEYKNSKKGGKKKVFSDLTMKQLCNAIDGQLKDFLYTLPDGWTIERYDIKDLKDNSVILKDYECKKCIEVPYIIDENKCVCLDMNKKQEVLKEYVPKEGFSNKELVKFIAKDQLGTKEALKIDKSKDAMSDNIWGDIDKSQLKKDCFMASNWETACKAAFLQLSDGYKDGKEDSLGYPVMQEKSGTLVYNKNGLASAKAYATKNNETAILSEVNSIYKKLGLDKEDNKGKKGELTKMSKKYQEMYSKMQDNKSKFSFDDSDNTCVLLDGDCQVIYLMNDDGSVDKIPFCYSEEKKEFSVQEDKKAKMDDSMEFTKKVIAMTQENSKKSKEKDTEIGKAFAKISSLETALSDAQNANKENEAKIQKFEKKLKGEEDEKKKTKASELMSKKEFSVFSAEEKEELINKSIGMSEKDFEDRVYSMFGKKIKDNITFSDDKNKQSATFMFTGDPHLPENNKESDDIYDEIRKKNKLN